ncbi:hypothetical protein KBC86_04475, partial [Candidatus Gracilibacteria bacterium]|nr:hypothetical protein [Candidatus Gracilibacteria bacterium]
SMLDGLKTASSMKHISISRVINGPQSQIYIDIFPLELSRRIGLPIQIDGYVSNGHDPYLSLETEKMLYEALAEVRGWQVIITNHEGGRRRDIRFFRNNT